MITSAIKKKADICLLFYFIKSIWYFKLGIADKKSKKESNSIVSLLLMSAALPIAPLYANALSLKGIRILDIQMYRISIKEFL